MVDTLRKHLTPWAMLTTARSTAREVMGAVRVAGDPRSLATLAGDIVLYRVLKLGSFGLRNRERTVRLRGGVILTYRLNRGDIQGMREVWFDRIYRLPFALNVGSVVDLGANIGLASVYFAKVYGATNIIAVEPNPENATLARRNLEQNRVPSKVVEAAIGPSDGVAYFTDRLDSNLGFVTAEGREVRMVSMQTLCDGNPAMEPIDLVKMDIEGGEGALLSSSTGWLDNVKSMIAEFHPEVVDYPGLARSIEARGFKWFLPGSVHKRSTDAFLKT